MQFKEGAAWAALEYIKWARKIGLTNASSPTIIVAGITYTQKSKYRSKVIMEYVFFKWNQVIVFMFFTRLSKPLETADIERQFLSEIEGSGRIAAKRLTKMLEQNMIELSINAPDWQEFCCI
jgi:glycerol-3-phosphate O-acyltransferase / dihydroxyacetone phosphate acyltransferase